MGIVFNLNESAINEGFGNKLPSEVEKLKNKLKDLKSEIDRKDAIKGATFNENTAKFIVNQLVEAAGATPLCTAVNFEPTIGNQFGSQKIYCVASYKNYFVSIHFTIYQNIMIRFSAISVLADMKSGDTELPKSEISYVLTALAGLNFKSVNINKRSITVKSQNIASINPNAVNQLNSKISRFDMSADLTDSNKTLIISK